MAVAAQARPLNVDATIAELKALFGDRVSTAHAVREQHGKDISYHEAHLPDAVVFAESTEEVQQIVQLCARHKTPIIPFGTGTSLEGHISAPNGGISLDVSRMNKILQVNEADLDVVVQPGVTRKQLNEYLRATGLFFPIDPGADASIGGMTSTRASGTNAVRYGTMRENVLSLQVVTPDGRIMQLGRRSRKSSAGYDLVKLFVGSEGTLGVITEITLRLYGTPESMVAATCAFDSLEGAVNTVIQTIQSGIPVARIELMDTYTVDTVNQYSKLTLPQKNLLLLEFHGTEAGTKEQAEMVQAIAAEHGGGDFAWTNQAEERSKMWQARHDAAWAAKALYAPIVGHVGDGNFHLTMMVDPDDPTYLPRAEGLNDRMIARAQNLGGTCTGEHGVGIGKIKYLYQEHGEAMSLMRAIKKAIDPDNIMNPGKIIGPIN
jgi:D-lactate dehydrogenase (cytochrome)